MRENFVQVQGENFVVGGKRIILRGFVAGTWMNPEHFMMGIPGTAEMMHEAFTEVYGKEKADDFFARYVENFLTEGDFEYFKSMGVNSVRLPFNYHYFMSDDKPGEFTDEGFEILDKVIELCRKYEIYAILDMHSTPGGQNPDWHCDNQTGQSLFWKFRVFQDQTTDLWRHIAAHYADEEWIAGYDILNEPSFGLTAEEFNGFYDRTIAAIREVDKDHIIYLEGDDFGRSFELFHEPQDPQIAYALHYYPFVYVKDVLDPAMPDEERTKIFDEIFYRQLTAREKFHRPLWCGECGMEHHENMELYTRMMDYVLELCEKNDVSWCLWAYKDADAMSIAMPKEDSKWLALKDRIAKKWSHHGETANSEDTLRYAIKNYFAPVSDQTFYEVEFRMRSIFHRLAVETILKPELKNTPWDEIKDCPEEFRFENCRRYDVIADCIRAFIARGK